MLIVKLKLTFYTDRPKSTQTGLLLYCWKRFNGLPGDTINIQGIKMKTCLLWGKFKADASLCILMLMTALKEILQQGMMGNSLVFLHFTTTIPVHSQFNNFNFFPSYHMLLCHPSSGIFCPILLSSHFWLSVQSPSPPAPTPSAICLQVSEYV